MLPFAFTGSAAVFAALDGALGAVVRGELAAAGLHAFRHGLQNGFHHITTSTRPIGNVADFAGLKIRSPGGAIAADFFATLGAKAGMVPFSGMYDALKAKTFDGQSDPHQVAVALKLYEVQTYLSLTFHWWSGFTLLAHAAAWTALPADIQWVVERTVEAFAKRQRADIEAVNAAGAAALAERGMIVNHTDAASIRSKLGDFYTRWKAKFPPATWRTLEAHADGLG
jgi:TRAP-type C4-dicarboxylate transport system substrate-binding protein